MCGNTELVEIIEKYPDIESKYLYFIKIVLLQTLIQHKNIISKSNIII